MGVPNHWSSPTLSTRMARFTKQAGDNECWQWTGSVDSVGYGSIGVSSTRTDRAHRVALVLATGVDIPKELVVDHTCRNRLCVNPSHLRLVSHRINNIENSTSRAATHSAATHCKRGHPKTPDNIYVRPDGDGRMCRLCEKERAREYHLSVVKPGRHAAAKARRERDRQHWAGVGDLMGLDNTEPTPEDR